MKAGDIIENYQGKFAKVIEIKGSRFGLSAWVYKKDVAALETVPVIYLNMFGLKQVLKSEEAKAPKAKAPKAE
ncbi:hypothetical protein [Novosphingobium aquae]|uniref:Uncharacterized protein n=1 Tax=Novosphingobium aquae TaxID=3133435 RepID=A0ABU8SBT9_9SPHN